MRPDVDSWERKSCVVNKHVCDLFEMREKVCVGESSVCAL